MGSLPLIGGLPVVLLEAGAQVQAPAVIRAAIAPGRGMMLLQAWARLADGREIALLEAPELDEAARRLNAGEADDFAGNLAFSFGGAILLPYANRIQGRPLEHSREIEADIGGATVRLPRNWGGRRPDARQYAMHGLVLDRPFAIGQATSDRLVGHLRDETFGRRWPSRWSISVEWRLAGSALELAIEARNTGPSPSPMGIGWHPWFRVPSGRREAATLQIPAEARAEVGDYDEVLPTGAILPVGGTPYDFRAPRSLGDLYLDDCFVRLQRRDGRLTLAMQDPRAGLTFELESPSRDVAGVQVYAPPDRPVVVIEPQFNWPDPFSTVWKGADTGMALVQPDDRVRYEVRLAPRASEGGGGPGG